MTHATTITDQPIATPALPTVPRLHNGDRLTRYEFERRYSAMPKHIKAELLDGVVYLPSPVRFESHGGQDADLILWLGLYRIATPGVRAGVNTTIRLDLDNEPQPDSLFLIEPRCGGQAKIDTEGYIEGGPELAGETTASTASYDLHVKFHVYRRNGVREYIVWRVEDREIDWFVLREGNYERLPTSPDGILRSETFPGLWLDAAAMIRGDLARVNQVLQQGVATAEHAAFVARLSASA